VIGHLVNVGLFGVGGDKQDTEYRTQNTGHRVIISERRLGPEPPTTTIEDRPPEVVDGSGGVRV